MRPFLQISSDIRLTKSIDLSRLLLANLPTKGIRHPETGYLDLCLQAHFLQIAAAPT